MHRNKISAVGIACALLEAGLRYYDYYRKGSTTTYELDCGASIDVDEGRQEVIMRRMDGCYIGRDAVRTLRQILPRGTIWSW
jgi:hypothetical protein